MVWLWLWVFNWSRASWNVMGPVFSAELSCIVIGVTGVAEVSGLGWISFVVVVGVGVEPKYSFLSRLSASGVVR